MLPCSNPIIYVTGATACGKSTLAGRLAADLGFYHISIGGLCRSYIASIAAGLPGMSDPIRKCVAENTRIPQSLLDEFETVPAILQFYNHSTPSQWSIELASAMIDDEISKVRRLERERGEFTGIIIDGYPITRGTMSFELVERYEPFFSGLTIVIESPRELAEQRYISRARFPFCDKAHFKNRMRKMEPSNRAFIEVMANLGEIVRYTNDGNSIDEAYNALLSHLNESSSVWRALIWRAGLDKKD
ncbi:P-loop containing nucleoside triphosphate hydrolase protein [Nemania sp. FL0916]|nr:P-loop containing nucleoside triphosphate hydrolase protein [Nemania sp. FL0916]